MIFFRKKKLDKEHREDYYDRVVFSRRDMSIHAHVDLPQPSGRFSLGRRLVMIQIDSSVCCCIRVDGLRQNMFNNTQFPSFPQTRFLQVKIRSEMYPLSTRFAIMDLCWALLSLAWTAQPWYWFSQAWDGLPWPKRVSGSRLGPRALLVKEGSITPDLGPLSPYVGTYLA